MVQEGMVDFTNQDIKAPERKDFSDNPAKVLRFKQGQKVRIHFTSMQVLMRRRHYNPADKKYYRCLEHEGYCPVCIAATNKVNNIKKASETFGANIIVYALDANCQPVQPVSFDVYFWAFGSEKFSQLRNIATEWGPLDQLDLIIECTDESFQKVTITNCRECLVLKDPALQQLALQKMETDSYPLEKFLCREKKLVELCQVFNLPMNEYIPQEILAQMTQGGNVQGLAGQQSQQAPPQQYQQPAQQSQQAPPQQYQQPAQQSQQAPPQFTPKTPDPDAFSDISQITNIL